MPEQTPPGYREAGTVTVTVRLANGPLTVEGAVLLHEDCGELVAPSAVGEHERLGHPEAGEAP